MESMTVMLKNLIPLSSNGLWLAEMTTPASALISLVRNAMPGVGRGPVRSALHPAEHIPAANANSSI